MITKISLKVLSSITAMFVCILPVYGVLYTMMTASSPFDTFVLENMAIMVLSVPIIILYFFRLLPSHLIFLSSLATLGEKVSQPWMLSLAHALVTSVVIAVSPIVMVKLLNLSPGCPFVLVLATVIFSVMNFIISLLQANQQFREFSSKMDKQLNID